MNTCPKCHSMQTVSYGDDQRQCRECKAIYGAGLRSTVAEPEPDPILTSTLMSTLHDDPPSTASSVTEDTSSGFDSGSGFDGGASGGGGGGGDW